MIDLLLPVLQFVHFLFFSSLSWHALELFTNGEAAGGVIKEMGTKDTDDLIYLLIM